MATQTVKTADFRTLSRICEMLNKEREKLNAPPLALSVQLCDVAQAHALDMVARGYFSNVGPDGVDLARKVQQAGYLHKVAANLTMGPESEPEVVQAFLGNPTQRDHALDRAAAHLGIGRADDAWVAIFGEPPPEVNAMDRRTPVQVLELINRARSQAGVMPLRIAEQLNQAAQEHAEDMATQNYLGVRGPDGVSTADRAKRAGYQGRTGSLLISGIGAADLVVKTWLESEQNRQNALNPDYRFLGVGTHVSRWVALLGTMPTEASATPELLQAALQLINRRRREAGVPELAQSDLLTQAAQEHAQDMVVRNYVGAQNPAGEDLTGRVSKRSYEGKVGGSFAKDQPTADHAVEAFLQSAADKAALLSPTFSQLGIGIAESRWVLVYGQPQPKSKDPRALRVQRMIELINTERAKAMQPPLQPNDRLMEAAQLHAEDMQRRGYAAGKNPEGQDAGARVTAARYPWRSLAELLASDAPDPDPIVRGWMQSPGHKAHLLKPELTQIGVGVAEARWDILLARPQ